MLFSLNSTSGLENIQTNANPTSYPQLSDDGKVLTYINDGNSSSIYDSRAHFPPSMAASILPPVKLTLPQGSPATATRAFLCPALTASRRRLGFAWAPSYRVKMPVIP